MRRGPTRIPVTLIMSTFSLEWGGTRLRTATGSSIFTKKTEMNHVGHCQMSPSPSRIPVQARLQLQNHRWQTQPRPPSRSPRQKLRKVPAPKPNSSNKGEASCPYQVRIWQSKMSTWWSRNRDRCTKQSCWKMARNSANTGPTAMSWSRTRSSCSSRTARASPTSRAPSRTTASISRAPRYITWFVVALMDTC